MSGDALLILAHADSWERRFQVSSLAASAAASGQPVQIGLFFAALAAWVNEAWDELDPRPPLTSERIEALNYPPLSSLLARGREEGQIRLYACSASTRFLDLGLARVQERCDAILGWPTFAAMIRRAERVVTL